MGLIHQGRKIQVISAELGIADGEYAWTARFQLAKPEDYMPMRMNDALTVTIGGETYALIVDSKELDRAGGKSPTFIISAISPTARLASPRAMPFDKTWDAPVLASAAVNDISGEPVQWDLVDWWIPAGRLSVTKAVPLDVIRTIASAAGGVVATKPNGTLAVRHLFPDPVPSWPKATIRHVLFDAIDNLSYKESFRARRRTNHVVVRGYLPGNATLSIELDDRDLGLNAGRSSFFAGETAHFMVHAGPDVGHIQATSSAGTLFQHAAQVYKITQDLAFDKTNLANLDKAVTSIDSVIWLGNDLGNLRLGSDGRTIMSERTGVAIARVTCTVRALAWGLSSPSSLSGHQSFPIRVQVTGQVQPQSGDGELVCRRGGGEFPGEDISDPLLSSAPEMLSRGRAEIDSGEDLQEIQLTCVFRPRIMPGHLVEVHDAMMGRSWRGKVTGVRHAIQVPKVTTVLDIVRPTP